MMIYTADGVSKKKTFDFLKKVTAENYSEIHTMKVYKGDKIVVDIAIPPYTDKQVSQVYSLSKTITSTAIGLLYDEGKIDLNADVAELLGFDGITNEYASELKVCHLLTMSSGHSECSMPDIVKSADGVKAFFAKEFNYMPGTDFTYDTGASYMLSAIVTHTTGKTMLDYLYEKLFVPLGINDCSWKTAGGRINEGGVGLYISAESLAKIAVMYLNGGVYNNKRILSEEWIETASKKQIDNVFNGTRNWRVGYGYQIWMNDCGGYRGDGAFGQYMIVIPEKRIACVALTESPDMEKQMDDIFEYLLNFEGDDEAAFDDIEAVYAPLQGDDVEINKTYRLDENPFGFTYCSVVSGDRILKLNLTDGMQTQTVTAGNGSWIENEIYAHEFIPELQSFKIPNKDECAKFVLSYRAMGDNETEFDIRYINSPHHMRAAAVFGEKLDIHLTMYNKEIISENAERLSGTEIKI